MNNVYNTYDTVEEHVYRHVKFAVVSGRRENHPALVAVVDDAATVGWFWIVLLVTIHRFTFKHCDILGNKPASAFLAFLLALSIFNSSSVLSPCPHGMKQGRD